MTALSYSFANEIIDRGSIKDADVLKLRGAFYDDGAISRDEASMLFEINRKCPVQDASWAPFFIEAMTDYAVHQEMPAGYVTAENAEWLCSEVAVDGKVGSKTELELLVNVLETARWSPPSLVSFCLSQVRIAVETGEGPLRAGQPVEAGTIRESEVELIRRMVYAFGGDGNVGVTRREAEVLFGINDLVADAGLNAPWTEFFVKAIVNVLMKASGYRVPSREEALRSDAWLDERGDLSATTMLKAIAAAGLDGVISAYSEQSSEGRALARLEEQRLAIVTGEEITPDEAQWLAERLGRDGRLTATEEALVEYLQVQSPKIDPALDEVIKRLGKAA